MLRILLVLCFGLLLMLGCVQNNTKDAASSIKYSEYSGYEFKAKERISGDTTMYFHFNNKSIFDSFFRELPNTKSNNIPETDFTQKNIIAIVKGGNNFYEIKIEQVELEKEVLKVSYTCEMKSQGMKWKVATPICIGTEKNYKYIQFIENGVTKKKLSVEGSYK